MAVGAERGISLGSCREFLAGLPDPVLILGTDGRIVWENGAAESFFRKPHSFSIIGLRYDDERLFGATLSVPQSEQRPGAQPAEPVAAALATGEPVYRAHAGVDRPRGGRLFLAVDAIPLHSELGGFIGVGVVYHDETEEVAQRYEGEWLRRELVESRRQVEENLGFAEALNAVGSAIHSTIDINEILSRVVEEVRRAVGVDFTAIGLREAGDWVIRAVSGLPAALIGSHFTPAEAVNPERAATTKRPAVMMHDGTDRAPPGPARDYGVRASLAVPLLVRGEAVGVLSLHRSDPIEFSREQIAFATRVATTTALAMENARVYSEERHIADTLQRALLVVPDQIQGIEFEHLYKSATEAAWVGGDFFDVFELPGERVVMVIGDISGKGVEASALASFTRQLIKAYVQVHDSPAEVVARTSDLLYRVSRTEDFVTLFLAVFCRTDNSLVFCNAGHPAPIVWRGDTSESLEDGGPIAGAWEGLPYEEHATRLDPGDLLVLFTDGLIEAKRDGELFGEERLLQAVNALAPRPLGQLAPELVDRVTSFTGGRLLDDVALLLVSPQ